MRWSVGCCPRELPLLTVEAPGAWHVRGTSGPWPGKPGECCCHHLGSEYIAALSKGIGQDGPVIEHAERPWGFYTVIAEADSFKVKTIEVRPGQRLSYQTHSRRSEHWFVVTGHGVVTLDGSTVEVRPGDAVDVPRGVAHRVQNAGPVPLVFIEVQHGDYFGEDDIVRVDDDYGRLRTSAPSADQPV
jgi:mannose-6-phosphate isomerase